MNSINKKILFFSLVFIIFLIPLTSAADYLTCATGETCIKIYHGGGGGIDLTFNSVCKHIINNHATNDYFIPPTTRGTDYSTFLTNHPAEISVTNCAVVSCPAGQTQIGSSCIPLTSNPVCVTTYGNACGGLPCTNAGTIACDGTCTGTFKAPGTDCNTESGRCTTQSGGIFTPGLGIGTVDCTLAFGKCNGEGTCIGWSGTGCDSCPFGTTTYSTIGGYPKNTICNREGNQATFNDGDIWYSWVYANNRFCKLQEKVSCGLSCTEVETTEFEWRMKP